MSVVWQRYDGEEERRRKRISRRQPLRRVDWLTVWAWVAALAVSAAGLRVAYLAGAWLGRVAMEVARHFR